MSFILYDTGKSRLQAAKLSEYLKRLNLLTASGSDLSHFDLSII